MGQEETRPPPSKLYRIITLFIYFCCVVGVIGIIVFVAIKENSRKNLVPKIELASMDFTVLNITETSLSAKWDLSVRVPESLVGYYICLQGDLQASFIYKNITLATSSKQKYYDLQYNNPQLLSVSAVVSGEDIAGLIGKYIIEDVKEKKEVKFGSRFSLTDCREDRTGVMSYACDEVTLRFEPRSDMKATMVGNHPNCINV